jgi:glutathione S-transferase
MVVASISIRRGALSLLQSPLLRAHPVHIRISTLSRATLTSLASQSQALSVCQAIPRQKKHSPTTQVVPTPVTLTASNSYSTSNTRPQVSNDDMADKPEPTGPIAKDGIELFTAQTPNGYKASIVLEELKEAYGDKAPKYVWQAINIMKNTQKQEWYTKICPNGRIPAIVDHDRNDFAVFEGLPILTYLTRHYDPDNKISFPVDSDDYSVAEQWMAWQHGGVGPMQGQANHFGRFAKEKIPYAIQRYVGESERLYGILDARLKDRDFVAGPGRGTFSIADISLLGWANATALGGIDLEGMFPHVTAWLNRCLERPGVKRGFAVPAESPFSNQAVAQKIKDDPEFRQKAEETKKLIDDAKAQYGYKYASP